MTFYKNSVLTIIFLRVCHKYTILSEKFWVLFFLDSYLLFLSLRGVLIQSYLFSKLSTYSHLRSIHTSFSFRILLLISSSISLYITFCYSSLLHKLQYTIRHPWLFFDNFLFNSARHIFFISLLNTETHFPDFLLCCANFRIFYFVV